MFIPFVPSADCRALTRTKLAVLHLWRVCTPAFPVFGFVSIAPVLEFELLETLLTAGFMECPWKGWAFNDKGYFSFSVDKPREGHFL